MVRLAVEGRVELAVKAIERLTDAERDFLRKLLSVSDVRLLPVNNSELEFARAGCARLTHREVEVTQLILAGFANKEIARQMGISFRTVEAHRGRAFAKVGARNTAHFCQLVTAIGIRIPTN